MFPIVPSERMLEETSVILLGKIVIITIYRAQKGFSQSYYVSEQILSLWSPWSFEF
jgi:hypothetical protein